MTRTSPFFRLAAPAALLLLATLAGCGPAGPAAPAPAEKSAGPASLEETAPSLLSSPSAAPSHAAPGETLEVTVQAVSPIGMDSVLIQLSNTAGLFAGEVSLTHLAGKVWRGSITVPASALDGVYYLEVVLSDRDIATTNEAQQSLYTFQPSQSDRFYHRTSNRLIRVGNQVSLTFGPSGVSPLPLSAVEVRVP